jgi:hypothetical protein
MPGRDGTGPEGKEAVKPDATKDKDKAPKLGRNPIPGSQSNRGMGKGMGRGRGVGGNVGGGRRGQRRGNGGR